ncbi:MAG: sensor histidine kinase [Bacteroidales bacterium]
MKKNFAMIRNIPLHLLFWAGVWFFFYWFFSYNSSNQAYVTWFSGLLLPLTMAVTYFTVYFLIPKYLLKRDYGRFLLFTFYSLIASSYFIVIIIYFVLIFVLRYDASNIPPMIKNFTFILILVYLIVGIVSSVGILNHNFKTEKRNKDLQNKILETQLQIKEQELNYLKMQIHPHFLFNTLNTLYGFALKQSKETPEMILKLSNLLDYILYQVNKSRVSLKQEVDHIREYIELEKVRFSDSLRVVFTTNDFSEEIQIAPMLLIPFVENAFKHGTRKEDYLEIFISIEVRDDILDFSIRNSYNPEESDKKKPGIGLENIRKRLDLHYEGKYELDYRRRDGWFEASLRITELNNMKDAG